MKITASIENITPAMAEAYLATMVHNRSPKDATIAMYCNDMLNGKWLLSPQGIAFNQDKQLFDGQHRLKAIIRGGLTIPMLVLRGFPAKQETGNTMDVLDAGIGRSIADRLKLMGTHHGNPNLTSGAARQIAATIYGERRANRKLSIAAVLEIHRLWKAEFNAVCKVMDNSRFRHCRNAFTVAAFTIAAKADIQKLDLDLGRYATGAGLEADSPLLELRELLLAGSGDVKPREKTRLALSALYCAWHQLPAKAMRKPDTQAAALEYFRAAQPDRFEQVTKLFHAQD